MYCFVDICISNFTGFTVSKIMQCSVFPQRYYLVHYYELKGSQNSTFRQLVMIGNIITDPVNLLFIVYIITNSGAIVNLLLYLLPNSSPTAGAILKMALLRPTFAAPPNSRSNCLSTIIQLKVTRNSSVHILPTRCLRNAYFVTLHRTSLSFTL